MSLYNIRNIRTSVMYTNTYVCGLHSSVSQQLLLTFQISELHETTIHMIICMLGGDHNHIHNIESWQGRNDHSYLTLAKETFSSLTDEGC